MGRILDEDDVISFIKEHKRDVGKHDKAYQLAHEHILALIDIIPTACVQKKGDSNG